MSELKTTVMQDIKTAMKAKNMQHLGVLRMLSAAIKQREVDERIELNDNDILSIIEKMIKQRKDAAIQYEKANRDDLVAQENFEISVLMPYLPTPLTASELDALISTAIAETGATSVREMGKVMAIMKEKAQGRADMTDVSKRIKTKLA
ncbi:MAG: glutamyl-tRNA amidotransferase [Legionellales bacterium]|nr:glutamyl-tRNA amidotransferase [Legionellales bacterium]|tara:strand:+ start:251 stop:697 length:447 start_codon:yes stop_codon:yes gene_type:complete